MRFKDRHKRLSKILFTILLPLLLTACGGGGGGGDTTSSSSNRVTPAGSQTSNNSPQQGNLEDVTLSWVAPASRENGEPIAMSEISGYRIYYNQEPSGSLKSVTIKGAYNTRVTIDGLSSGTYRIRMTTLDTKGLESGYSSSVRFTI